MVGVGRDYFGGVGSFRLFENSLFGTKVDVE